MITRNRSLCRTLIPALAACLTVSLDGLAPLAAEGPALIPQPVKMEIQSGRFPITPATKILYAQGDARLADAADYLAGRLSLAFDKRVTAAPTDAGDAVPGAILMTAAGADPKLGDEGYSLSITRHGVVVRAPKAAGAFYGGITLLQLAPPGAFRAPAMVEGKLGGTPTVPPPRPADEPNISKAAPVDELVVPCATVWDRPRFSWRGLLIDPARHYWTIDELKQYVDYLALHKLNKLQIHFTDHQNWTVEVRRYPNLTPEKALNAADPQRERNRPAIAADCCAAVPSAAARSTGGRSAAARFVPARRRRTRSCKTSSMKCWRSFPANTSTSAPTNAASGTGPGAPIARNG